ATARRIVDALLESDAGLVEQWPALRDRLPATARDAADGLVTALTPLEGELVVSHAERLRAALAPLVEQNYDDAAARLCDLDALVDVARRAERLADVATELTLEPPQSSGDLAGPPMIDEDWLVISTVHSAKGLEWDVVHVLHATDGNFPSDMALTSNDGLEEERRVFYVGVTRPRHSLHVYVPLRFHVRPHHRDDAHMYGQPSRFLTERVTQHFDRDAAGHDEPAMAAAATATATRVELSLDALWS
ncbi:MAG TPA: 3'-5' exonuclease, partial [Acidimicrobiia bacterium]|nr:3'-5' exonuclease [Acidimicrobiia bacterium]